MNREGRIRFFCNAFKYYFHPLLSPPPAFQPTLPNRLRRRSPRRGRRRHRALQQAHRSVGHRPVQGDAGGDGRRGRHGGIQKPRRRYHRGSAWWGNGVLGAVWRRGKRSFCIARSARVHDRTRAIVCIVPPRGEPVRPSTPPGGSPLPCTPSREQKRKEKRNQNISPLETSE